MLWHKFCTSLSFELTSWGTVFILSLTAIFFSREKNYYDIIPLSCEGSMFLNHSSRLPYIPLFQREAKASAKNIAENVDDSSSARIHSFLTLPAQVLNNFVFCNNSPHSFIALLIATLIEYKFRLSRVRVPRGSKR